MGYKQKNQLNLMDLNNNLESFSLITNQEELIDALASPRHYEHKHLGQILFQMRIINPRQLKETILEQSSHAPHERCDYCHRTGHSGRLAAYELLQITPKFRELINQRQILQILSAQPLSVL